MAVHTPTGAASPTAHDFGPDGNRAPARSVLEIVRDVAGVGPNDIAPDWRLLWSSAAAPMALGATGGKAYGLAAAAKPTAGASPRRGAPPLPAEGISRAGEAASPRNLSRAASAHALTALENSIDRSPRPRPGAPPPSKAPSPVLQPKKTPDWRALPSALDIAAALAGGATSARRQLVVFLDYDGTLTPIVEASDAAVLAAPMRAAIARLAQHAPVAVVSLSLIHI